MTLVMFGHPMCPCTRASMSELIQLSEQFRHEMKTYVVFAIPDGTPNDWKGSYLWERAASIPELSVISDPEGTEARRFGVETSGHIVLYDKEGYLVFNGGITQIRGHEGDSFGRERIVSILTKGVADKNESPVFGCALH